MLQKIKINYINTKLHIGLVNWREVYIYSPTVAILIPEVERGRLAYREKGSMKRISYLQIKKGLLKRDFLYNWKSRISFFK